MVQPDAMDDDTRLPGIVYARDLHAPKDGRHEDKFANLYQLVADAAGVYRTVLIFEPKILGDTYDELVTSMELIARGELSITVIPSHMRPTKAYRTW